MQPDATINELPSIWFIRRCRTVLLIVCQLMSAYRLAKAEKWGQLNCDETKRHQTAYLNLVLSCVEESCEGLPPEHKPILMSACILPEDESSEAQKDAIVAFIDEKNEWLDEWATLCEYEDEEGKADGDGFSFHWLSGKVDAVFSAKSKKNFANGGMMLC